MQYTLRNIPPHLDAELRKRARREKKSLNQVAIEAMASGLGVVGAERRRRAMNDVAGTWKPDPSVDKALAAQDRVDPKMWK